MQNSVLILYGSQTGTAKYEAESFGVDLAKTGVEANVRPCDSCSMDSLSQFKVVLFMVSTTGQGDPPFNMRQFWESIFVEHPSNTLNGFSYSIFGFGDSTYAKYNFIGKVLAKRMYQLGAHSIVPVHLGNENTVNGYMNTLQEWKLKVLKELAKLNIAQKFTDEKIIEIFNEPKDMYDIISADIQEEDYDRESNSQTLSELSSGKTGRIIKHERLTEVSHFQRIYNLYIELSEPTIYKPGDLFCVHYQNCSDHVCAISKYIDYDLCSFIKINTKKEFRSLVSFFNKGGVFKIEDLLRNFIDFVKPPSLSLIRQLNLYAPDEIYREKLQTMNFEDYYEYIVKEKRNLAEVLFDFRISKIPFKLILNYCPAIRPREFSIASSFLKSPNIIRIVYGVLEYETPLKSNFRRKNQGTLLFVFGGIEAW
jgi:sulfite reductase alpha subunit-like flavoprotein